MHFQQAAATAAGVTAAAVSQLLTLCFCRCCFAARFNLDSAKKEFNALVKQIGELRKVCVPCSES